jgi:protein-disulfide isomerase
MIKRLAVLGFLCLIAVPAGWAQTSGSNDDLTNAIKSLNESNKAILQELQEIKKLLANQQQARPAPDALPTNPVSIAKEPFKGAANAKVALIEFSDYQCPFCGRYDADTYPQIQKEYVDTGKIKYVWRDLPLDFHKQAFKAAEAAHCAGEQGKFWEMHDHLFANQKNLAPEELPKFAEALKLDKGQFQQCIDSSRYAEEIKKDITEAGNVGISGTPSFLVGLVQPNGTVKITKKLVGAKPYAEFKAAIDSLLAPAPAGTN